jgi:anti-sigma-K factor RskA
MSTDIHALSGAYAVDALDPDERAEFERHLAGCEACRAEVGSLREAAAALADLTATAPPAGLRDRVLADASVVRPLPPVVARSRRRRPWTGLVAAAAAAALIGGGIAWHPWDRTSEPTSISAVDRFLHAPDTERVATVEVAGGGRLTVYRSASRDRAAVVAQDLPRLPAGRVYQMWLQDARGAMAPAGTFATRSARMVLDGPADAAIGAGMTVEPAGGSQQPTSDPLALVAFGRA